MNKLTLETVDQYLGDERYAFIDIREGVECLQEGIIKGFHLVPFYSVLKAGELFYPVDQLFTEWVFEDEEAFKKHFPKDKTIVLICRAGNRTKAVEKALRFLGYDSIIDIGGIIDYKGKNLVFYNPLQRG